MLDDKILLITGGTGTIGIGLIEYILTNYKPKVIRIYSRDETKQARLLNKFKKFEKNLRFLIGDIRDKERLNRAMKDVDIVFHLAALKHVLACEYNPFEAIKTNVLGLKNLIEVCTDNNIEKLIFTSTDKAASPTNTMGVTNLLSEKLISTANYYKGNVRTIFYSVRFGNVLGSRGSLIPIIEEQIKNNTSITLTHSEMTRYIMAIYTALKLIFETIDIAQGGEVFVFKMKTIKIVDLIDVLIEHFSEKLNKNYENIQIEEIGMFAGEKLYGDLFSSEEADRTYETKGMYIIIPQMTEVSKLIDLEKFPDIKKFDKSKLYISKDGPFLTKSEIKEYLIKNNTI